MAIRTRTHSPELETRQNKGINYLNNPPELTPVMAPPAAQLVAEPLQEKRETEEKEISSEGPTQKKAFSVGGEAPENPGNGGQSNHNGSNSPFQLKEEEEESTQLKAKVTQKMGHDDGCGCESCVAAGAMQQKVDALQKEADIAQFVRPADVGSHTFLGISIPASRGVNPEMRTRLTNVEAELQRQYDAIPATDPDRPASLAAYAGIVSIKGWRETTSLHGTGRAVDVNYDNQPYIATRTTEDGTTTYGGEQGGATSATRALRQPAVEVYDRAVAFIRLDPTAPETAEVHNRVDGESATDTYRRFRAASDALSVYLSLGFSNAHTDVNRVPVANPETADEATLLSAIPVGERLEETVAVANIQAVMDGAEWQATHPAYSLTAREQYIRILRDYEIVRKPMQYGNPSTTPGRTRNPANGFLHMPEHFVVAMMDIGDLRWGACEFSGRSNGDVHHFDLGTKHHSPAPAPAPAPAETTGTEGGEAPVTRKEATPAQMQAGTESGNGNPNRTGLPNNLKAGVEELSGISMDGVTVHYNSNKPAQVQALAYAQGTDIHIGPGQEKHLPHEAWHIVQQKQGRVKPTTEAGGMPVNDDRGLETEADVMGAKALQLGARESGQETSQGENAAVQQQKSVAQRQFMGPPAPTGAGADFDQYMLQLQGLEAAASADGFSLNQTITAFRKLYYNSGGWNTIIAGAAAQGFPPSWLVAGSTEAGAAAYITAHKEIAINGTTVDVGHLLTGLDAANHPASLSYAGGLVNLRSNQEAATYVGDLGSVVTEYVAVAPRDWVGLVELDYPLLSTTYTSYAEDVDMAGNVDSYSITMDPTKSLSQNLLDYYTSTSGGATKRYTSFARSIGLGTLRGGTFTGDTPAFRTALRDEIYNFAIAYLGGTRGKWGAITNWGGTVNYSNVADWVVIIFMVKLASKVASE